MLRSVPLFFALSLACAGCGARVELDKPAPAARQAAMDAGTPAASLPPVMDAGTPPTAIDAAGPPSDPMAACAVDRDVFHVDITGTPGPYEAGSWTFTNHDSQWSLQTRPELMVMADQGGALSIQLEAYTPAAVAPGTYSLAQSSGNSLDLAMDGDGCGLSNGGFTIWRVDAEPIDAATPAVTALSMTFEGDCAPGWATMHVRGCIRFEESR
jgi:hypothetical protein